MQHKIRDFFAQVPTQHFTKGELLIFADGAIPDVFFLEIGSVTQYAISENGSKTILTIFKPGSFFPMSAALNHTPNQYFFEAQEACTIRRLPAAHAVAFLESHPDITLDLLKRVYKGTDGLLAKLADLMGNDAYHRVKTELTILSRRFGSPQEDGSFMVKVTEQELAQMTGLARETISKTLTKLSKEGFVRLERGQLSVHL